MSSLSTQLSTPHLVHALGSLTKSKGCPSLAFDHITAKHPDVLGGWDGLSIWNEHFGDEYGYAGKCPTCKGAVKLDKAGDIKKGHRCA